MNIEDIEIGKVYQIEYIDLHYPCSCKCHEPGANILHVTPCCHDFSYQGPATYTLKLDCGVIGWSCVFVISPTRFVTIPPDQVEKALPGSQKPIEITDDIKRFLEKTFHVKIE